MLAAEPATVAGWPIAQRLERARALRKFEPERGLAELEALHAAAPGDRSITFAFAAARLAEGDASAVETMRALAKEDASWRAPVYARLVRYHDRIGDRAGVRPLGRQLERVRRAGDARLCISLRRPCRGQAAPTTRPAPLIETLRAGLAADPAVAKAWLVEAKAPLVTGEKARVVTLRAMR